MIMCPDISILELIGVQEAFELNTDCEPYFGGHNYLGRNHLGTF